METVQNKNIYQYKLYLFDLDGTIIDSEPIHWDSYNKSYIQHNLNPLTYEQYIKIAHNPVISFKKILKDKYESIYKFKEINFKNNVETNGIKLIPYVKDFVIELQKQKKIICIVTHSPKIRTELIRQKWNFLKEIPDPNWITFENFQYKKPNPECYIQAIQRFNIQEYDTIGFEDSYKGYLALDRLMISKIFINSYANDYPFPISSNNTYTSYKEFITKSIITPIITPKYVNNVNNNKCIENVAIVAAGKGTRLKPLTNHIPKLLVNLDNKNLLEHMIDYWKEYTNNFVIIIQPQYNNLVSYYVQNTDINYSILNVNPDNNHENSYTIKETLNTRYNNQQILITWCDLYPGIKIPKNIFQNQNIIFTHGNKCRYYASKSQIRKESNGNVIGIYYFPKYRSINNQNYSLDICDIYQGIYPNFETYDLSIVNDVGDSNKLNDFIDKNRLKYQTRYFNYITKYNDITLIKKSICQKGDIVIKDEINWYKHCIDNKININIPTIWDISNNSFKMHKLDAVPLYEAFNSLSKGKILEQLIDMLSIMHQNNIPIKESNIKNDIDIEFKTKIINRINDIEILLSEYDYIKYINGVLIEKSYKTILSTIHERLTRYFSSRKDYSFIHGDCQFSNTLYDIHTEKLYLIDPRGYFGNTKIYGLPEYDYAKVCYSLSGYDTFNNNPKYYFEIKDNNIETHINIDLISIKEFLELLENKTNISPLIIIDMIVINWFGLTQYNKNNILKCVASYYQAIYLYQLFLPLNRVKKWKN